MSLFWSAQRSGGCPLGRRHDDDGVYPIMSMAWVPGCRRHMCPKAPRRSLRIVVVSGGCPVRVIFFPTLVPGSSGQRPFSTN